MKLYMRYETKQLKTAIDHLMPLQQHLYNGLARPADYSITALRKSSSIGTGLDLPAQTACWPTAIVAGVDGLRPAWRVDVCRGQKSGQRDR